jgi:hypothetical protein
LLFHYHTDASAGQKDQNAAAIMGYELCKKERAGLTEIGG